MMSPMTLAGKALAASDWTIMVAFIKHKSKESRDKIFIKIIESNITIQVFF